MTSSLLAKMYWACSDPMTLASQLSAARDLPSPDVLQRRVSSLFDQMSRKCREAGIPDEDANEAKYAIAAFTDEQIFRSAWPGRSQWMGQPLQLIYFNENTAGEGFFQHMAQLQTQPSRSHVLEIYYLCLCLGFQGQYAVRGGEGLGPVIDQLGARLGSGLGNTDVISPHGEPREAFRGLMRREMPLVGLSIAFFGLAVVVFIVLKAVLWNSVNNAATDMTKGNAPAAAQAAPGTR
ncbi:MAG TPA: type IVB secretion system protein IcmH/DotU [Polyangiaceae bacterium]|jgi:type VI secretion system protein ImpK